MINRSLYKAVLGCNLLLLYPMCVWSHWKVVGNNVFAILSHRPENSVPGERAWRLVTKVCQTFILQSKQPLGKNRLPSASRSPACVDHSVNKPRDRAGMDGFSTWKNGQHPGHFPPIYRRKEEKKKWEETNHLFLKRRQAQATMCEAGPGHQWLWILLVILAALGAFCDRNRKRKTQLDQEW